MKRYRRFVLASRSTIPAPACRYWRTNAETLTGCGRAPRRFANGRIFHQLAKSHLYEGRNRQKTHDRACRSSHPLRLIRYGRLHAHSGLDNGHSGARSHRSVVTTDETALTFCFTNTVGPSMRTSCAADEKAICAHPTLVDKRRGNVHQIISF